MKKIIAGLLCGLMLLTLTGCSLGELRIRETSPFRRLRDGEKVEALRALAREAGEDRRGITLGAAAEGREVVFFNLGTDEAGRAMHEKTVQKAGSFGGTFTGMLYSIGLAKDWMTEDSVAGDWMVEGVELPEAAAAIRVTDLVLGTSGLGMAQERPEQAEFADILDQLVPDADKAGSYRESDLGMALLGEVLRGKYQTLYKDGKTVASFNNMMRYECLRRLGLTYKAMIDPEEAFTAYDGWQICNHDLLLYAGRVMGLTPFDKTMEKGRAIALEERRTEGEVGYTYAFRTRALEDGTKAYYCEGGAGETRLVLAFEPESGMAVSLTAVGGGSAGLVETALNALAVLVK